MVKKPKILVVDDEAQMVGIIAYALETQGFNVGFAYDGKSAIDKVESEKYDLIVLDINMPKMNGFDVCLYVREHYKIPVILLTARDDQQDIVQGLELGADDYITKPFNPRELALRVSAILRRSGFGEVGRTLNIRDLCIDYDGKQVIKDGCVIPISHNEFQLLECFARNAGKVLSWRELIKDAWDLESWEGGKDMLKTAVYRIRQKIEEDPSDPEYIRTIRGIGYVMPSE
jgi:two-component system response regulator MtrA